MDLTILICTYNRVADLKITLDACDAALRLTSVNAEVLVCANGCTDSTVAFLSEFQSISRPYATSVHILKSPGKSEAFRLGVLRSRGDYTLVLDDDNSVCAEWIQSGLKLLHGSRRIGVIGCASKLPDNHEPPPLLINDLPNYAVGAQSEKRVYAGGSKTRRVWGAGMIFLSGPLRSWFSNGHNFVLPGRIGNNLVAGEDTELCLIYSRWGYSTEMVEMVGIIHRIAPARLCPEVLVKLWRSEGAAFQLYRNYEERTCLFRVNPSGEVSLVLLRLIDETIRLTVVTALSVVLAILCRSHQNRKRFNLWCGRGSGLFYLLKNREKVVAHFKIFNSYASP